MTVKGKMTNPLKTNKNTPKTNTTTDWVCIMSHTIHAELLIKKHTKQKMEQKKAYSSRKSSLHTFLIDKKKKMPQLIIVSWIVLLHVFNSWSIGLFVTVLCSC